MTLIKTTAHGRRGPLRTIWLQRFEVLLKQQLCDDSHLEEVGSLRDYGRVQFWFGPDVVGILEKLVPLGNDIQ